MAITKSVALFEGVTQTASANGDAVSTGAVTQPIIQDAEAPVAKALFLLDVTAASGTSPTLDVKIQGQMPVSGAWVDLPSMSFTQATAVSSQALSYTGALPHAIRGVSTIGGTTPSFTFSLEAVLVG